MSDLENAQSRYGANGDSRKMKRKITITMEITIEMILVLVRMGIFVIFLMTAAWQDLKTNQIRIGGLCLSGAAALAVQALVVWSLSLKGDGTGADLGILWLWKAWFPYLAGLLPGAALLVFSWLSGGIGAGDGCFFLISGLFLGLADNLLLLCGAVLSSGLFGLGYYVFHCVNRCRTGAAARKKIENRKDRVSFFAFCGVTWNLDRGKPDRADGPFGFITEDCLLDMYVCPATNIAFWKQEAPCVTQRRMAARNGIGESR